MRDYLQEKEIFYREVKHSGQSDIGERIFLVQWEREPAPKAIGVCRYAILGGEFHMLKLINRWNRQFGWKYQLLPDIYQEKPE